MSPFRAGLQAHRSALRKRSALLTYILRVCICRSACPSVCVGFVPCLPWVRVSTCAVLRRAFLRLCFVMLCVLCCAGYVMLCCVCCAVLLDVLFLFRVMRSTTRFHVFGAVAEGAAFAFFRSVPLSASVAVQLADTLPFLRLRLRLFLSDGGADAVVADARARPFPLSLEFVRRGLRVLRSQATSTSPQPHR